jgi:putative chitinase
MKIDRNAFFDAVRAAFGALTPGQVDGFSRILAEWERRALTDVRWLAYMLATAWHETGRKMQPIREGGGEAYLRSKKYYPWVGEGLVQVTWEANARKFGAKKPGDLLTWPIALEAMFRGMIDGVFTGKKLATYFGPKVDDPVGARRIINGTDEAAKIAGYHRHFLAAIKAEATPAPRVILPPLKPDVPVHPVAAPQPPQGGFFTRVAALFRKV